MSLSHGAAFALAGAGVYNLARLGSFSLLTKFTSPETVGAYTFALALCTPLVLMGGLELRAALVADAGGRFPIAGYRAVRRAGLALAALLLAGVTAWYGVTVGAGVAALLAAVAAGRLAWGASELRWGVFQKLERFDLIAWAMSARGLTLLAALLLVLPLCGGVSGGLGCAAAALALAALSWIALDALVDRPRMLRALPAIEPERRDPGDRWALAAVALPLGLVQLLIALGDSLPRLVLGWSGRTEDLAGAGYFGAVTYVAMAANLAMVAVTTAAGNRLAVLRLTDPRRLARLTARLTGLAAGLALLMLGVMLVAGRWLLTVLFQADYAAHYGALLIVVGGQSLALFANVFGGVTTFLRLFWVQVPLHLLVLAATALSAWWLIPGADPVNGAAWTSLVRSAVQALLYGGCVIWALRAVRGRPAV